MTKTSCLGRSLPAIPPPPSAAIPNGNPVIGRQGHFVASSQRSQHHQGSSKQSRFQANSHSMRQLARQQEPVEELARFERQTRPISSDHESSGVIPGTLGGSARLKRASKTLAATAAAAKHRNGLSTMSRADSAQLRGGHSQSTRSQQHTETSDQITGMVNCDTEDEDFYYYCNQNQTITKRPSFPEQYDGASNLLQDYASHTYKQPQSYTATRNMVSEKQKPVQGRVTSHSKGSDLMMSKPVSQQLHKLTANSDLNLPQYNYHNLGNHQYQFQTGSRHQNHVSHMGSNGGSKKQLTWSDQVEIA